MASTTQSTDRVSREYRVQIVGIIRCTYTAQICRNFSFVLVLRTWFGKWGKLVFRKFEFSTSGTYLRKRAKFSLLLSRTARFFVLSKYLSTYISNGKVKINRSWNLQHWWFFVQLYLRNRINTKIPSCYNLIMRKLILRCLW